MHRLAPWAAALVFALAAIPATFAKPSAPPGVASSAPLAAGIDALIHAPRFANASWGIEVVSLYFAARRPVVERDGALVMVDDERFRLESGEAPVIRRVRFRTLGCYPLTGAVESDAADLDAIIAEMEAGTQSERAGRLIDRAEGDSMEKKKREGYF